MKRLLSVFFAIIISLMMSQVASAQSENPYGLPTTGNPYAALQESPAPWFNFSNTFQSPMSGGSNPYAAGANPYAGQNPTYSVPQPATADTYAVQQANAARAAQAALEAQQAEAQRLANQLAAEAAIAAQNASMYQAPAAAPTYNQPVISPPAPVQLMPVRAVPANTGACICVSRFAINAGNPNITRNCYQPLPGDTSLCTPDGWVQR